MAVHGGWRIGGALAWERSTLRAAGASSHGDGFQLGLAIRCAFGALELSGSLSVGEARNDLSRQLPEGGATVEAKQAVRTAAAWLGGAYTLGDAALHLKPRLDLGIVSLRMPGFDERGTEPLRLRVGTQTTNYAALQPGIEMGAEFMQGNGMRMRPRLALAVSQFIGQAAPAAGATFASDSADATPFASMTRLDRTQYALSAGLQMASAQGTVLTSDALAATSKRTRSYGLSVRMEMPF